MAGDATVDASFPDAYTNGENMTHIFANNSMMMPMHMAMAMCDVCMDLKSDAFRRAS